MAGTASTMKKSLKSRIRITRNGKVIRRPMGIAHFKAKKSSGQKLRKKADRSLHKSDFGSMKKEI